MTTFVGLAELVVFILLAQRVLRDRDHMIEAVLYCFVCGILNYKIFDQLPWLNVGISLYPEDFLVVLMFAVLVLDKYDIPKKTYSILLLLLIVMIIQSMARGLIDNGINSEFFADLRKYLYFSVSAMYAFCVPFRKDRKFYEKILDRTFNFLTIYAIIIMTFYFVGMQLGTRAATRPLSAVYAIIYAAYTAYKWYKDLFLSEPRKIRISTLIYTVVLVLNRFNTTWVALAVALGIMFVFNFVDSHRGNFSWKFWLQVVLITGGIVTFFSVFNNSVIVEELTFFFDKFDTTEDSTYTGRMEVWEACLSTVKGLPALFGFPFGSGFYVAYRDTIWKTIPHSGYIETIMRLGYIGIIILILVVGCVIFKAFSQKKILPVMICGLCLVFWYAYELTLEQGLLIGSCAQYVNFLSRFEKEEQC